jgi:anaerobic magnesium-protoporphyrin IX monomethyl ester cyclase
MRIILVQSWLGGDGPPVFPVALACLAASLSGHDVACFDPNTATDPLGELVQRLQAFAPDVVGISLRNIDSTNTRVNVSYLDPFSRMLGTIKKNSAAPVIVGGSGFSMFAEPLMAAYPAIDYGVSLEGERTLAALIDALAVPDGDPAGVPSLFVRTDSGVRFTGQAPKTALEDLPSPDFSVLPMAPYRAVPWGIGVETKRGCALSCLYCPYGFLNGRTYRKKSPQRVAEELFHLQQDCGLSRFTFLDSIFNVPEDHARAVMQAMIDKGVTLSWSAWFTERGLTREFLEMASQAGCDTVIFSPDAYGDAALAALGKAVTQAEIKAAYTLIRDMDCFEVSYNFFKNPPGQTLFSATAMVAFILKARLQLGRRAHFELNAMRVEPHTALAKRAAAEGRIALDADLLVPVLYSQRHTAYIEKIFNCLLKAVGK